MQGYVWLDSTSRETIGNLLNFNNEIVSDTFYCLLPFPAFFQVFQRRFSGQVRFQDRNWNEYKRGFGHLSTEFWIGKSIKLLGFQVVSGIFGKKHLNARGFAREFLRSGILFRPGKSLKKRDQSSRLHSKKNFLLGGCGLSVSDVISGGLSGHLCPLCLALASTVRWQYFAEFFTGNQAPIRVF